MPLGPLRRLGLAPLGLLVSSLGLAPLGLLVSSLGLAPLGLLASSLGLASLGLRINHLLCCHPSLGEVAGTVAFALAPWEGREIRLVRSQVKSAATKKGARRKGTLQRRRGRCPQRQTPRT